MKEIGTVILVYTIILCPSALYCCWLYKLWLGRNALKWNAKRRAVKGIGYSALLATLILGAVIIARHYKQPSTNSWLITVSMICSYSVIVLLAILAAGIMLNIAVLLICVARSAASRKETNTAQP